MMDLDRRRDVRQVRHRRDRIPEPRILFRPSIAGDPVLPPASSRGRRRSTAGRRMPVFEQVLVGGRDARPDYSHFDAWIDYERPEGDVATERMTPHADPAAVGIWITLQRRHRVQDIDRVAG